MARSQTKEFSIKTRNKISHLAIDSGPADPTYARISDFPKDIPSTEQGVLQALRYDAEERNRQKAIWNERRAQEGRPLMPLEEVPTAESIMNGYLALEFFGRVGILDGEYVPDFASALGPLKSEFRDLPPTTRMKYAAYLGSKATSVFQTMLEQVEDQAGPYAFEAQMTTGKAFIGYVIDAANLAPSGDLPAVH